MIDPADDTPRTVADLVRVTGLADATVKALVREGTLPGYKLGKKYVVPAGGYRALLAGTWKAQPREVVITNISPIRTVNRKKSA